MPGDALGSASGGALGGVPDNMPGDALGSASGGAPGHVLGDASGDALSDDAPDRSAIRSAYIDLQVIEKAGAR